MLNFVGLLADGVAGEGSMLPILLIYGGFIAFMYFVLFRPQRKKQKEVARMQSEIKIGDSILTTAGMYGVVVDIINDVFMVEFGTNKSVRVPIVRSAVSSVAAPNLSLNTVEPKEIKEPKKEEKDA